MDDVDWGFQQFAQLLWDNTLNMPGKCKYVIYDVLRDLNESIITHDDVLVRSNAGEVQLDTVYTVRTSSTDIIFLVVKILPVNTNLLFIPCNSFQVYSEVCHRTQFSVAKARKAVL